MTSEQLNTSTTNKISVIVYTIAQPGKAKVGGRDRWPHNNSFPWLRGDK